MHSITLLKFQDGNLTGRAIMSQMGRLFQRDLMPSDDPSELLKQEPADMIVTAFYSPAHELDSFLKRLQKPNSDTPIYLVASDLNPDAVIRAVRSGARDVFLLPLVPEELLKRLAQDSGTGEPLFAEEEWRACCAFLESGTELPGGANPSSDPDSVETIMVKLESERFALERERESLAEERERLNAAATASSGAATESDDKEAELQRQAADLEDQRYAFEEQKIFLMDAQREIENARTAWEDERLALEESNKDLREQLENLSLGDSPEGEKRKSTSWLRNSIGSLPLTKRSGGHNLSSVEINDLMERVAITNESRRGLEAELDEVSRSAEQARARQVELEQEVADLRSRYENTGGGGLASGGSLLERLERLSESITTTRADLESVQCKRKAATLQIETLSSELAAQEITEALTPTQLGRIREVNSQRKELQKVAQAMAADEIRFQDALEHDSKEILMIQSWVDELESAGERLAALRVVTVDSSETETATSLRSEMPAEPVFQEEVLHEPALQEVAASEEPTGRKGTKKRAHKSGHRRFSLRGVT